MNPDTHPRRHVSLRVAAEYLGINERTLTARVDQGDITAFRDGRVWRFAVADLVAYDQRRRHVPRLTASST